jgi:hypothetical protein
MCHSRRKWGSWLKTITWKKFDAHKAAIQEQDFNKGIPFRKHQQRKARFHAFIQDTCPKTTGFASGDIEIDKFPFRDI